MSQHYTFDLSTKIERNVEMLVLRLNGVKVDDIAKPYKITGQAVRACTDHAARKMRTFILSVINTTEGFYYGDDMWRDKSERYEIKTPKDFYDHLQKNNDYIDDLGVRWLEVPNPCFTSFEMFIKDKLYWLDKIHQLQEKIRLVKSGKLKLNWIGYGKENKH